MATPAENPTSFEPLMPSDRSIGLLREQARDVVMRAQALRRSLHSNTLNMVRLLVRQMNSYYSNKIEGQATHPIHIAQALHRDFSQQPDIQLRQRIAVAHIDAERAVERMVRDHQNPFHSDFLRQAHASLYAGLTPDERTTSDGILIEPGAFRSHNVTVGQQLAPAHTAIHQCLDHWDMRYASPYSPPFATEDLLWMMATTHHRMAWIHPFEDGNGRAVRLQSHAILFPLGAGLWSINRGLAREREAYYAKIHEADSHRLNDFDGRGFLSERRLFEFASWMTQICLDQVSFMSKMLDLNAFKDRLAELIKLKTERRELIRPIQYVFFTGPLTRGDFKQMTGLEPKSAQRLLSSVLSGTGDPAMHLLESQSTRDEIRPAIPLEALRYLFPNLYPDVDVKFDSDLEHSVDVSTEIITTAETDGYDPEAAMDWLRVPS